MKRILTVGILTAAVLATGCTRIETGELFFVKDLNVVFPFGITFFEASGFVNKFLNSIVHTGSSIPK